MNNKFKYCFFLAILLTGFIPKFLFAATIGLSSGQGYEIGSNFAVQVLVSTESSKPLNAVSGNISFSNDKIELVSISKVGSIINFWAEEPKFSNSLGTVNIEGVVLNPGWSGNSGKVVTLNFKVKSVGTANINFSSASILANDGLGTNIITSASPISILLNSKSPVVPPIVPSAKPVVPISTSTQLETISTSTPVIIEPVPIVAQTQEVIENRTNNFSLLWNIIINYLSLIIIIILVVTLILALLIYSFYRLRRFKRKVSRGINMAEKSVHHDFEVLREELEEYREKLFEARKKRNLTREEKIFILDFKKYISKVERDITSRLDSIEKGVDE